MTRSRSPVCSRRSVASVFPVAALLVVLAPLLMSCRTGGEASSGSPSPAATSHYIARVTPLNGSGVSGTVMLQVSVTTLAVRIDVTGLTPNQRHFQHIHGAPDTPATCPTPTDANPSGTITLTEALLRIGPVAFDIQPYPLPDATGAVHWSQTFTMDPDEVRATTPWTQRVVVFHGMTSHGVYDRLLPAACGPIQAA
jgi:hypothetical protein